MDTFTPTHQKQLLNSQKKPRNLLVFNQTANSGKKNHISRHLSFPQWVPVPLQEEIKGEFMLNNPIKRGSVRSEQPIEPEIDMRKTIWPDCINPNKLNIEEPLAPPPQDSFLEEGEGEPLDMVESVGKSSFASNHSTVVDHNAVLSPKFNAVSTPRNHRIIGFHNYFSSESTISATQNNKERVNKDKENVKASQQTPIIVAGGKSIALYKRNGENLQKELDQRITGPKVRTVQEYYIADVFTPSLASHQRLQKSEPIFKSLFIDLES